MKKLILCLSAIITLSLSSVIAQSNGIEIRLDGMGADLSGTEQIINLNTGNYDAHLHVTNNTNADEAWKITRKKISVPSAWTDVLCWGEYCFTPSGDVFITPGAAPIVTDGTELFSTGEVADLHITITPDQSSTSSALYRYYITNTSGAYVDSIDVSINYVLGVSAVKQSTSLSISPNPADENVKIALEGIENSTVKIVDVLGNVVYNESINNGTKSIDVSNFKNGVYFVLVEAPGIKSFNRKLIIRH
ncbi:MAG: hypothetical protein RI883_635 [Bacteroidota bacterium]|jgi:hypothetical protein